MDERPPKPELRVRIAFGAAGRIGPDKADLLAQIARTGSIAAAGREMGMSYRRAWSLVEHLDGMFRAPLVRSGSGGRGVVVAALTETGGRVLTLYRAAEAGAARAGAVRIDSLASLIAGGQG